MVATDSPTENSHSGPERRVLVLASSFPPQTAGGSPRIAAVARYLSQYGWTPYIVTLDHGTEPDWEQWLLPATIRDQLCRIEHKPPLICDLRVKRWIERMVPEDRPSHDGERPRESLLKRMLFCPIRRARPLLYFPDEVVTAKGAFMDAARRAIHSQSIQAVFTSAPSHAMTAMGYELCKETGLPWICQVRDPLVDDYVDRASCLLTAHRRRRAERSWLRLPTTIIVDTESYGECLLSKYDFLAEHQVAVLHAGYEPAYFREGGGGETADGLFTLVHAGSLARYRARARSGLAFLKGFAAFLRAVPEAASKVRLHFAGAREAVVTEAVQRLGLTQCTHFLGWLPHDETLRRLQKASVLVLIKGELVPDDPNPARAFQIPQKTYEYLGTRRPVLAVAPESDCAQLIREMNAGLVASPSRPQEITEALVSLYQSRHELDDRFSCDEEKLQQLQYPTLVGKLARLLDKAAAARTTADTSGSTLTRRSA